ncbi:hypothetical protein ACHAWF_003822 [Thalassiosira exigua]
MENHQADQIDNGNADHALEARTLVAQLISQGVDEARANWLGNVQFHLLEGISKLRQLKETPSEGDVEIIIGCADTDSVDAVELPAHHDALLPGWTEFANTLSSVLVNRKQHIGLIIRHVRLTSKVTEILLRSFKTAPLQKFALENNALGSEGIKFVASAVEANESLEGLLLLQNPIETKCSARALIGVVKIHPHMKMFNLRECSIGQFTDVMLEVVSAFDCMKIIDLGGNRVGSQSAEIISKSLAQNAFLKHLYLENNLLTDTEAILFADALRTNTNLRYLGLNGNKIRGTGIRALEKAVLNKCSMNEVYYSNHTCHVVTDGHRLSKILLSRNTRTDPNKTRMIKIQSTLYYCYGNTSALTNLRHDLNNLPIELMPNVLALFKDKGAKSTYKGTALFQILRKWNMPHLYTSCADPEPRRSKRIRTNKIAKLLRE